LTKLIRPYNLTGQCSANGGTLARPEREAKSREPAYKPRKVT